MFSAFFFSHEKLCFIQCILYECNIILFTATIPTQMPHTAERFHRNLTPSQRLAIYEHVVQVANSSKQTTIPDEQMTMLTQDWVKEMKKGL